MGNAFILYSSNESLLVTLFTPTNLQSRISFQTSNRDCAPGVPTQYRHQARYPSMIQRHEGTVVAYCLILRFLVRERNRRVATALPGRNSTSSPSLFGTAGNDTTSPFPRLSVLNSYYKVRHWGKRHAEEWVPVPPKEIINFIENKRLGD